MPIPRTVTKFAGRLSTLGLEVCESKESYLRTTQLPLPGFEPKALNPQSRALTSRSTYTIGHDTDSSLILTDCYKFSYLVTLGFFINWIFKSQQDAAN